MFVINCSKGQYYNNETMYFYGWGNTTSGGGPLEDLIENIGPCNFIDNTANNRFTYVFRNNDPSTLQYYVSANDYNIFQEQDGYYYLEADIRLGNVETNFNLEYQIIAEGSINNRIGKLSFNSNDEYKTINNQAAEMIKHTVEDLEDKRIFVVATFYEKKTVIDVASSSFGADSSFVYDRQNHYTDTFTLYDTSGEQISSNDITYNVVWLDSGDNVVYVVQDVGNYRMRATLSTPDPDRVTILLDGALYNKGTYIEKTLSITPQPINLEE